MNKHMIPMSSPLMLNPKKSHCFNGRERNNKRNDCNQKALCNEFVKNISSNELESSCRLSASFNKPLDQLDLTKIPTIPSVIFTASAQTSRTAAQTSNIKNKHIKWHYPETNGTDSSNYSQISPFIRNSSQNETIGERKEYKILNDFWPVLSAKRTASASASDNSPFAIDSAHTLTQTLQQINNSMQSQTTPQLNCGSKRKRNRNKRRKITEKEHQLLRETNITSNDTNNSFNGKSNTKRKNWFKKIKKFRKRKIENNFR